MGTGELQTVSLHAWENEEHLLALPDYDATSCTPVVEPMKISAGSPDGRCVLVRVNKGNWALIPLGSGEDETNRSSEVFGSGRISEKLKCSHVLDFTFLEGFPEPTLAVLYESGTPCWPAHLSIRKDTVEMLVVTLSLHSGLTADTLAFTQIFHRSGIPSECRRLVSVPRPTGGVLCCGPNVFVHVDPVGSSAQVVCPINGFGHVGSPQAVPPTTLALTASRHVAALHGGTAAIWCSIDGEWYWLRMMRGASGTRFRD